MKPLEIIIRAKDQASSVFSSLGAKVGVVAGSIAGLFGIAMFTSAVRGAAELEAKLSEVKAVSGATADEMKLLRKAAEDAGATTKFTATEGADALGNLTRAGLSAKDAIAALPAVLQLAQAGGIGLGEASEYVTKTVMGMGLAFTDAGRVADVLAMGANASNTSVTGLAQALSYAAPVAKSLGLDLEFTVAIIGKFADAGIDASRAGTALNAILSQFKDPAGKFRQELAAAGITTGNFEQALRQLAAAGPAGQRAILAVGTEAGPALTALLNQGIGALDGLKTKLDEAKGSAAATAATMEDNLPGAFNSLSSAWDTVKNALATPVLPVLKDGVTQLATALRDAVSSGTIKQFGESIATAFQAGLKWAREFAAQIDFAAIGKRMTEFAAQAGDTFREIGEAAQNTGNIVKTAYGVMSAGVNAILTGVYAFGEAWARTAQGVMNGIAMLREGMAKITFGDMSKRFQAEAKEARDTAGAFGAAADAMREKGVQSFEAMANGATIARAGWAGLTQAVGDAKPVIESTSNAIGGMAKQLQQAAEKNAAAKKAVEEKKAADEAALIALQKLRQEYEQAVAAGNWQLATEKIQQLKKATDEAAVSATDNKKKQEEAARDTAAAFERAGISTKASLKVVADVAMQDYERIKASGLATSEGLAIAWKRAADAAIAANDGVAPSWLRAQAAAHGYELQVDTAGKATVKAAGDGAAAVNKLDGVWQQTTEGLRKQEEALDRIAMKYKLTADYTERQIALLEKDLALQERRDALERKRLNVDKNGFSLDKNGNTLVAGGDLTTLTGIAAFLKSAGVADDNAARNIAREFADALGNVTFDNNPGVRKYGGPNSTISDAVLKAAERYTFGAGAPVGSPVGAPRPSTIPEPTRTVNVNFSLDNKSYGTARTDDAGAAAIQGWMDALIQAKAAAGS